MPGVETMWTKVALGLSGPCSLHLGTILEQSLQFRLIAK